MALALFLAAYSPSDAAVCGEVVELTGHDKTTTRYALARPAAKADVVLVLLPGGDGHLQLDNGGCARKLTGNSLVRGQPDYHRLGVATALLDAPSDHQEGDGLGGFRIEPAHAEDIGLVVADLRRRTGLAVWLIGTSRGSISAANAASRLSGAAAPDGVVLTSPVTSGYEGGRKAWVAQTVFSVDLSAIHQPLLVVAHAEDKCIRTPPGLAPDIAAMTNGVREQTVTVTGGPGWPGNKGVKACRGKAPHGFVDQEAEVIEGIVRFVRGGAF